MTKNDMITEIIIHYKAGCVTKGIEAYRTDELYLALAFRSDAELRMMCQEIGCYRG